MKRSFRIFATTLVAVVAMITMACKPGTTDDKGKGGGESEGEIILNHTSLEFTAKGGEQTVTVTGIGWTAIPEEEWIAVMEYDGKFTVTVTATTRARSGEVTVKNSVDTQTLVVTQAGADTPGPAQVLYQGGIYYGDAYGAGTDNFTMAFYHLSDMEEYNGFQIVLDVVSIPMDTDRSIRVLDIPAGTYSVSKTPAVNTIVIAPPAQNGFQTCVTPIIGGVLGAKSPITGGTMTVEGDNSNYNIKFDLTHENGTVEAEFEGPIEMLNPNYKPDLGTIDFGTLSHIRQATYYKNAFGNSTVDAWMFSAVTNTNVMPPATENGWLLNIQFHTQLNGSNQSMPEGKYTIGSGQIPWTVLPGGYTSGKPSGIWLYEVKEGTPGISYALTSGAVESSYSGGVYTITVDAETDDGWHIIGTIQDSVSD